MEARASAGTITASQAFGSEMPGSVADKKRELDPSGPLPDVATRYLSAFPMKRSRIS